MEPQKKAQMPLSPEEGLYDGVELSTADDETLEVIKRSLSRIFHKHHRQWSGEGVDSEKYGPMIAAGSGFAAVCTEQRERAMLRAHQKHFKKK